MRSSGKELSQEFDTALIQDKSGAELDTGYMLSYNGGIWKLESCYLSSSVTER